MFNKVLKNVLAFAGAAAILFSMGATASASTQDASVYAKFCKDGKGSSTISMMQKVVDGPCEITNLGNGTSQVVIPVTEFSHSMGIFSGDGKLTALVIGDETYEVTDYSDTDNDGYEEAEVSILVPTAKIDTTENTFTDVTAEYEITLGSAPLDMSSEADLYFSNSLAVYE